MNTITTGGTSVPATVVLPVGSTHTGLDQLVSIITSDSGLAARIPSADIAGGAAAADAMNALIVAAIRATGVANDGDLTAADLYDVNAHLRANHLDQWTTLHGDDECGVETGFHLVQNDGATTVLFDRNAVNTVADGIYHLGFEVRDGKLLNEDGAANARLTSVADWLGGLMAADLAGDSLHNAAVNPYVYGSTGTGLDQLVAIVTDDAGLNRRISNDDIRGGATAADGMNALIVDAIRATGVANNGDLTVADLYDVNSYLRTNHLDAWTFLHGDDEDGQETGFHLVQNDGKLLNEDGNANASLRSVAQWLGMLLATDLAGDTLDNAAVDAYVDGSTGTGLDQLVAIVSSDAGLSGRIANADIRGGASAADGMNALVVEAIRATGVANDGDITTADVRDLNSYLRTNHLDAWTFLHGDDEDGQETGFHLVQNDGAERRRDDEALWPQRGRHRGRRSLSPGLRDPQRQVPQRGRQRERERLAGGRVAELAARGGPRRRRAGQRRGRPLRRRHHRHRAGPAGEHHHERRRTGPQDRHQRDLRRRERGGRHERADRRGDPRHRRRDGASSKLFDRNAVDTVADGIYHMGFEIRDGRFLNEDGAANASLAQVSQWLGSLLAADLAGDSLDNAAVDLVAEGTTATGLDRIVEIIGADAGLGRKIATSEIYAGASAADGMNRLIVDAIRATGAADGGTIDAAEVRELNAWLRANHLGEWAALHGDDGAGVETGFHLVQGDGATTQLLNNNAVNTVADGLYHMGFEIRNGRFLNEDGMANASVSQVSQWLNALLAEDLSSGELLVPDTIVAPAVELVGVEPALAIG